MTRTDKQSASCLVSWVYWIWLAFCMIDLFLVLITVYIFHLRNTFFFGSPSQSGIMLPDVKLLQTNYHSAQPMILAPFQSDRPWKLPQGQVYSVCMCVWQACKCQFSCTCAMYTTLKKNIYIYSFKSQTCSTFFTDTFSYAKCYLASELYKKTLCRSDQRHLILTSSTKMVRKVFDYNVFF